MGSTDSSMAFKVSNKTPEKHSLKGTSHSLPNKDFQLIQNSDPYKENHCTEVLQGSNFPAQAYSSENGFVWTVIDCYNKHHNLVLRPDDIWAAIMTQFSFYINKNAEEFRGKFVNFEGKKTLAICMPGNLHSCPYDLFVKLMTKKIDENLVDPEVKNWILPNFSTTTDNDLVAVGVIFMAAMKNYFGFGCGLACGIPYITLEGTVDDWKNIHGRLEKLKEYKLEKWYSMLEPILQQFVNAKEGKVERDFWQKICHYESGGSGPTYVSGWITSFCVFDVEGNWQVKVPSSKYPWSRLDIQDIPSGSVEVDVTIDDNGTIHKSIMFAGHMAAEVMEDGCTLKPVLGWAIALTTGQRRKTFADDMNDLMETLKWIEIKKHETLGGVSLNDSD